MKLSQYDQGEAQIQGLKSKAFGFQLNAKMYDIVINKLYQNKPGAVIRELFANAWDSHVASGNVDTPIEIYMPSWLDQNFGIRDFGTGIPHEDFEDIYTNVGESTKEDSNEFIGAFGLGSKTPFTMTDTYIIENWHGGRKTTWLCFKSNGTPEVSKVGDEPSDEPSGLQCSFSFDSKETVKGFHEELTKQLMFFPVKPTVTGGDTGDIKWQKIPKHDASTTFFFMEGQGYSRYSRKHYVVMGNVAYPFTLDDTGLSNERGISPMFNSGTSLVILAKLGDVDIPPSREQLELTDKTKTFIKAQCYAIMDTYVKEFVADIGAQPTLLAARKYVYDANVDLVNSYMQKHNEVISFGDGASATWDAVKVTHFADKRYTVSTIYLRYKNVLRADNIILRKLIKDEYVWFINDLTVGGVSHLNKMASKVEGTVPTKQSLIVKPQSSYNKLTHTQDVIDCKKYIEDTYGVTTQLLSDVTGFPVQAAKTKSKVTADQIYKVQTGNKNLGLRTFSKEYTEEDFPTTGYYVELKNWHVAGQESTCSMLFKEQINAFLGRTKENVYLVRTKSLKKLPKTVKPFDEYIKTLKTTVLADVERLTYLDKLQTAIQEIWKRREALTLYTFNGSPEYALIQRYVSRLKNLPTNIAEAHKNYRLVFTVNYDKNNHPNSTGKYCRDVPAKLTVLNQWFKDNAGLALDSIGKFLYGTDRKTAVLQLQALLNLTNKKVS